MEKKTQDFSMEQAKQLAQSAAGQQLLSLLQQADGAALRQATDAANQGDFAKAAQTLSKLLTPQMRQLAEQLRGQ